MEDFSNFRRFHNHVKKYWYEKYVIKTDKIVEMACGKAGDIHKWNCEEIVGFDINPEFLKEAESRNNKVGKNCSFYQIDLTNETIIEKFPEQQDKKYDVIVINFAIHFFLSNHQSFENLMINIKNLLKPSGLVIGCCLDGNLLDNIENDMISIICNQKSGGFGDEILIRFKNESSSSEGILRDYNKEYLVYPKFLINSMKKYNFVCLNLLYFFEFYNNKFNLNETEKCFSFKNFVFAFKNEG